MLNVIKVLVSYYTHEWYRSGIKDVPTTVDLVPPQIWTVQTVTGRGLDSLDLLEEVESHVLDSNDERSGTRSVGKSRGRGEVSREETGKE